MKTQTQLNERQQLIIMGILRDLCRILRATVNYRKVNSSRPGQATAGARRGQRERHLRNVRAAREGLASVNLWRWLGRSPSGVDRVLCHRELLRLESMGLLTRKSGRSGRRTTHVKLTPIGQRIARKLLANQNATDADETTIVEDFPLLPLDWSPPVAAHATAPP